MLRIGAHLTTSKGYLAMGKQAAEIDANTFAFFTRNPRGGSVKALNEKDVNSYHEFASQHDIKDLVAHAPYTLNLCGKDEKVRNFAFTAMEEDLKRMEYFPGNFYNFHPGSHVGQGIDKGIELIAEVLNTVMFEGMKTTVLLEVMAGKGSEVGSRFEEIAKIIELTQLKDNIGVCFDSCHLYDAGYDVVNNLDDVIKEFDDVVGIEKLKAMHLNDSKNPYASHKDRHEKIGDGALGIEAFRRIINHEKLRDLPFILETPNEIEGYKEEISLLRSLYEE
ncbi:MAG: deoxyribonuclease IV [Anaerofustis stercorihominis]|nr:deoxyribonuclease IV [Anaerofustis stercorihominis]